MSNFIATCTCRSSTQYIEGMYEPTEVNEDDECVHCGFYAHYQPASKHWEQGDGVYDIDNEYEIVAPEQVSAE